MFSENKLPDSVPCFLCGLSLEVRRDKKAHPYFICDDCGIQTFVRGATGISKLSALSEDESFQKFSEEGGFSKRAEMQNLKFEIEALEKELSNLPFKFPWDPESQREKALKSKLSDLRAKYEGLLEK